MRLSRAVALGLFMAGVAVAGVASRRHPTTTAPAPVAPIAPATSTASVASITPLPRATAGTAPEASSSAASVASADAGRISVD
jgi:hypothetical protein